MGPHRLSAAARPFIPATSAQAPPSIPTGSSVPACVSCGGTRRGGRSLIRCPTCKLALYCGVHCQNKDRPVHRAVCSRPTTPPRKEVPLCRVCYATATLVCRRCRELHYCSKDCRAVVGSHCFWEVYHREEVQSGPPSVCLSCAKPATMVCSGCGELHYCSTKCRGDARCVWEEFHRSPR
jgi:hypothetical protein